MKKKITNSQELNNYYKMVNTKLKKFIEMDIPHNKIASYLRPGTQNFKNFISEDDDLKDVDGIDVVLKDIIQDTLHAFKDGLFKKIQNGAVKKFENYVATSAAFDLHLTDEDVKLQEKALCDIYRISLSHVNIKNRQSHLYTINDDGTTRQVMVYSQTQLLAVKEQVLDKLIDSTNNKFYLFKELELNKKIKVGDILDMKMVREELSKAITDEDVIDVISSANGLHLAVKYNKKVSLNGVEYHLFEVVSEQN